MSDLLLISSDNCSPTVGLSRASLVPSPQSKYPPMRIEFSSLRLHGCLKGTCQGCLKPTSTFHITLVVNIKGLFSLGHLWLRKFLSSSYSIRTLRSWSKKIPALGIHVIKAYTEFQQYLCIIFEDMSILLSAIFIFHGLILLLEAETSEQHRCLVIMIIILNIWFMVLKTTGLNPVFQRKNQF